MPRKRRETLGQLIGEYLAELAHANHSSHTCRAYAYDLRRFAAFHQGSIEEITPDVLRAFGDQHAHLSPASRARKQAALSSFFNWACRHDRLSANPMLKIERVQKKPALPRSVPKQRVEAILSTIPAIQRRDRLMFRLLYETGMRIGEALRLHVEDLDLTRDNEHVIVTGKKERQRTILLDDPRLVKELRAYLKATAYQHGPLFRASKNGRGDSLSYQGIHYRWTGYCAEAGIQCTMHQLRHSHATEMVNGGVSLATIRKRLGHRSIQTTLLYAETSDTTADAEVRAWRRRQNRK